MVQTLRVQMSIQGVSSFLSNVLYYHGTSLENLHNFTTASSSFVTLIIILDSFSRRKIIFLLYASIYMTCVLPNLLRTLGPLSLSSTRVYTQPLCFLTFYAP
jgi:hypothetical protein